MWKALTCIFAILLLFVIAVSGVKEQRLSASLLTAQQQEADHLAKISGLEIKMAELEKVWTEFKETIRVNQTLAAEKERLTKSAEELKSANEALNATAENYRTELESLKKQIEDLKKAKIQDLMI